MAKRRKRKAEENTPIEPPMTAMIDVIFQLLIFFMLTMKFVVLEGKLLSHLPKDKGLSPSDVTNPEINEVRILFCADGSERGLKKHFEDKGSHDHEDNKALTKEKTTLVVEGQTIGILEMTEKNPDKAATNSKYYDAAADHAARIYEALPSSSDPTQKAPIKLDPDSEVPYEHVMGVLNALKRRKIDNIEFVGNPRLNRYFGPKLKTVQ